MILLLGMLCYMPTWSLTNAIAMANAPSEKFPQIRVFGSIGWVAAAVFSLVAVEVVRTGPSTARRFPSTAARARPCWRPCSI